MKDYYPKAAKRKIPQDIYLRSLNTIRALPRLQEKASQLLHETYKQDVHVQTSKKISPTEIIAMRREKTLKEIEQIEKAFETVPEEYRLMLKKNIIERVPMEMIAGASPKTISRMRLRVIIEVARNTGLIDEYEYKETLRK